jgi:hypothetical protein
MFQRARKHINPATILALAALVFATTGGAFAATGGGGGGGRGSTPRKASAATGRAATFTATVAKKKAKPKAGARGPAGPRGATGATGPGGPAGSTGGTGATGATGPAGATGTQGAQGPEGKQGPSGTTGFTATLPEGDTETGTWAFDRTGESGGVERVSLSFPVPLAAGLAEEDAHFIEVKGEEVSESEATHFVKAKSGICLGTVEHPTAPPGNLCVYSSTLEGVAEQEGEFTWLISQEGNRYAAGTAGAIILFFGAQTGSNGYGSWAVTAPVAAK